MEKYGVSHPSKCPEIYEKMVKNMHKRNKEYKLPSGNIIFLQGYEPLGLDLLLSVYDEKEICWKLTEMPKIRYTMHGTEHRYYPDFFIPSDNIIIEVKSWWTFERGYTKNMLKKEACRGFTFTFLIWDEKRNLTITNSQIRTKIISH